MSDRVLEFASRDDFLGSVLSEELVKVGLKDSNVLLKAEKVMSFAEQFWTK